MKENLTNFTNSCGTLLRYYFGHLPDNPVQINLKCSSHFEIRFTYPNLLRYLCWNITNITIDVHGPVWSLAWIVYMYVFPSPLIKARSDLLLNSYERNYE